MVETFAFTRLPQVGLGTDCSGGFSPSLLDAMRQAVIASNVVHFTGEVEEPLSFRLVFSQLGVAYLGIAC